jgi:FOG: HEAT repeat
MVYSMIVASKLSFMTSSSNSTTVQILIIILFVFILLLTIGLLLLHFNDVRRTQQKNQLKKKIQVAAQKAVLAESHEQAEQLIPSKEIFTRRGLAALADVIDSMDGKGIDKLKEILLKMDLSRHLSEELDSKNEDYLLEIIHLAGELNLSELEGNITQTMFDHKGNINEQYEAFLALARFGSYDDIVKVCLDKDFKQMLSFRSLQEIISAYTGDKPALYKTLLASPDAYIVRICVKAIGQEKVTALAPDIVGFLDSENMNLVIEAMRSLSALSYTEVEGKIITLLKHDRWEVRGVAVQSLAALDLKGNVDNFITALQDSEWQVRFNAGKALCKTGDDSTHEKVLATGDKYALDMLDYMINLGKIGGAVQ